MPAHPTVQGHTSRRATPAPIPTQMLSLTHRLKELDNERELRDFLNRTLTDECDIRHLSGAMVDAIRSNNVYLVKELLRRQLPISPVYVFEAVNAKAKDILTTFFASGWDINKPMSGMDPPILTNALEDWEMTGWLLDHGAYPNVQCDIDSTPLSYAVKYADLRIVDLLLRRGGDVRKGQLLHHAMYRECDTVKVVKELIDRGAPLNSLMYQGHQASWDMFPYMRETPLQTAVALKKRDFMHYLIGEGANMNIENAKGQTVMQSTDEDIRDFGSTS